MRKGNLGVAVNEEGDHIVWFENASHIVIDHFLNKVGVSMTRKKQNVKIHEPSSASDTELALQFGEFH